MSITTRLRGRYNVDGELIHRPTATTFGRPIFGSVEKTFSTPDPLTATGYELAQSILIAEQYVERVQSAIDNMRRILDSAPPLEQS